MTHRTDVLEVLTPEERGDLHRLEGVVRRGKDLVAIEVINMGYALEEIVVRKLWRGTHTNADDYLREVWGLSRERARQLRTAAPIMALFGEEGIELGERQVRDLKLRQLEPGEQRLLVELTAALSKNAPPGTSILGAAVDAVRDLAAGASVQDPVTGEHTRLADLPPDRRVPALVEAVRAKARDTQTFQGADFRGQPEERPFDWADTMGDTAEVTLTKSPALRGWRASVTDTTTGVVLDGPVSKTAYAAIRAWRARHEPDERTEYDDRGEA